MLFTAVDAELLFSCSVVYDSLSPHGLQNADFPSLHHFPELAQTHVHLVSDAIQMSSSIILFSCLQSFPTWGYFLMNWLLRSGGQSIGVSASASVLPMNTQDSLGWTGWISLQSRDSQESSPTSQLKSINSLAFNFLYSPTLTSIHDHWKEKL